MVDNLKFWFGFLVIIAVILAVGWRQPLRYRFMSSEEIYALEHPAPPVVEATPRPSQWMLDPQRKTMLDRRPYGQSSSGGSGSGSGTSSSRSR